MEEASTRCLQPLGWQPRLSSSDLDEVRSAITALDGRHVRGVNDPHRFEYLMYREEGSRLMVRAATIQGSMNVRGQVSTPVLHLAPPRGSTYDWGSRRQSHISDASVVYVPPDREFRRFSPSGMTIAFASTSVAEDILCRHGREFDADWRPEVFALDQGALALWWNMLAAWLGARQRHECHGAAIIEARLLDRLVDFLRPASASCSAGRVERMRVARVEEWIDAHLCEPITLADLCRVADVGERALQQAFSRLRGRSPMRFLTERRLLHAYERLRTGEANGGITGVAHEMGFTHLGRFARDYGRYVGELPSQTLAGATPGVSRRMRIR